MWHGYARYRDRWAVRQLHAAARAASKQDRAPGSHRHDRAAGGVCGSVTARGADGPAGGRGECAPVVRVDVSHSKTRNTGVDKMRLSAISYRVSAGPVAFSAPPPCPATPSVFIEDCGGGRRPPPPAAPHG